MIDSIYSKVINNMPFKRKTIRSELMAAFIIVIFFSSITVGSYYFYTMNSFVKEKVMSYNSEIIKQAGQKLDFLLENIEVSKWQLLGISTNQDIFNISNRPSSVSSSEFVKSVEENLKNVRRSYPGISDIFILGFNGDFYTSNNSFNKERLVQKEWIKAFQESDLNDIAIPTHRADYQVLNGSGKPVISFLKKVTDIKDAVTQIGIIQVDLDYRELGKIVESISTDEKGLFFIMDSNNKIIYFPEEKYLGLDVSQVNYNGHNMGEISRNENLDKKDFVVSYTLQSTQWQVIGVIPLDSIYKKFNHVTIISFYICLITFIFSLFVAYSFSKRITKPINMLITTMKKVGEGNFSSTVTHSENTDLQVLSSSFNTMVDKVNNLMIKIIKKESESANARFIALQAQINPHFLYNTLETIRSIALRNNIESIADISKSMATIFRYSIDDKSDSVILKEELEHVKNYIRIQKYRYGDKFDVSYDIDENLLDCEIIKLVLQPLVENAIYHGIELKKKRCKINITCKETQTGIIIIINDDGLGMRAEVVKFLNDKISNYEMVPEKKKRVDFGIGIINVNARIKLYYGNEYGLYIESILNEGTSVVVKIPAQRRQMELDSDDITG